MTRHSRYILAYHLVLVLSTNLLADDKAKLVSGWTSEKAAIAVVIAQSLNVFEKQNAVELSNESGYRIAVSLLDGKEKSEETHICVFGNEPGTGIDARCTKRKPTRGSILHIAIVNAEYGATVTGFNRSKSSTEFSLSALEGPSFTMDTFWQKDSRTSDWLQDSVKMQMTSRYFNFGNTDISKAVAATRARDGEFDFSEASGNRRFHELRFKNWPTEVDQMTYRIDPVSFAICEIEAKFGELKSKLEVLQFMDFKDVKFPQKLVLTNIQASGETLVKRCEWQKVPLENLQFKSEQLHLPYYGLPNPNMGDLPRKKSGPIYLYVVLGLMLLGVMWAIKKWRDR